VGQQTLRQQVIQGQVDSGLNTESYTFYQETTLNSFRKDGIIAMVDTQQSYNKLHGMTNKERLQPP
jgi:hypothetical protein